VNESHILVLTSSPSTMYGCHLSENKKSGKEESADAFAEFQRC
jgi:hypothetical protein